MSRPEDPTGPSRARRRAVAAHPRGALTLAATALLLAAPAAGANRPATADEEATVRRDLGVAPGGPRCSAYLVSTAPGDGAAYVRIQPIEPLPAGCPPAGDTFVVARGAGALGPWTPVIPGRPGMLSPCADAGVPEDVGADLAACSASRGASSDPRSRTTLGCYPNAGATVLAVQRRRPSRCLVRARVPIETFRPQQSGRGFDLRGVRWKGWGTARATGTGVAYAVRAQTRSARRVRVTLVATKVGTDGGRRFYTALRVRTPTGTTTLSLNPAF